MKKRYVILSLVTLLAACAAPKIENSSISFDNSSNDEASSLVSSVSESISSASKLDSSSSLDSSSIKESSSIDPSNNLVVDGRTAQELVVYSSSVDLVKAVSSRNMVLAKGYDGGIRYEQNQSVQYTTYSNDITIGEGNLSHVQSGKTYTDTFTHLKMLKDYTLIDAKAYDNGIFEDSTQKSSLMNSTDPSQAYATALKYINCGAGYVAYEDFYYIAVELSAEVSYEAYYEEDGRLHITFYAEVENQNSNQVFFGQYDYYFDNIDNGFLEEYHAEQAFYSYDRYKANDEDISNLEPMYYGKEIILVTAGSKTAFTGTLPIDIESTFVKSIKLSAKITTIEVEEVVALKAEVLPKTASDKSLHFASSNESVARVDYTGRVTGITPGKCTIYAVNYASGVEGEIEITVISKHALEPGDDATKGDLKEALQLAENQCLMIERIYHDTIVGMMIDEEQALNGVELSKLSISDFAYNEVTRTATYVGNMENLYTIIPFLDNGNDNLSNRYILSKGSNIYKDNILGMEVELDALNQIGVIHFRMRTDSVSKPSGLNVATLTDANVATTLGDFSAGYARDVYYESEGFYQEETEDEEDY